MRPVRSSDITLGKPLILPIFDRTGMLLLDSGAIVSDADKLEMLNKRGFVAQSNEERGAFAPPDRALDAGTPVFEGIILLKSELETRHRQLLSGDAKDFSGKLFHLAWRLIYFIERDSDAALAAMQLDVADTVMVAKLLHAGILCHVLTGAMKLEDATRFSILCAALTYDVALSPIAETLNQQSAPLTTEQKRRIANHPEDTVRLLRQAGVEDAVWLDAVMHHHERIGGSGYPDRIIGEDIALPARMLAIVDIYTAMIRPRAYRDAVHAQHALRDIFMERGRAVDEAIATVLIKEIGIYPPGTLVRLLNNEIAVVVRRGADALHPDVRCIIDASGLRQRNPVKRNALDPGGSVIEALSYSRYRSVVSNLNELWHVPAKSHV